MTSNSSSFTTRDLLSALLVVIIWGTNFVAMKVGLRSLTPFQMGAARYVFAILPLILVFFLARFGVVTAGFMWRHFRYAILIIFVIAAVATPSADPVNQTIFAAPMIVLYLISIVVAWAVQKKKPADDPDV